jgi:hypothetical protein
MPIATASSFQTSVPAELLAAFQAQRIAYYQAIAAANPSKAHYLAAWIARSEK